MTSLFDIQTSIGITGFLTGLGLIVAIGAQNAFVLKQGLLRQHVLPIVAVCGISDAVLITVGVFGSAQITALMPSFAAVMRWGGAAFLFIYGARSALSAWRGQGQLAAEGQGANTALAAVATCLALTWLNPHVYLDTVVLVGAISTEYAPHQTSFALGAATASLLFFIALGYGARLLAPVFARPRAWQILDGLIAVIMWSIAVSLVRGL